jgi:adenosylcobinamide-GDP ribazoletransferase
MKLFFTALMFYTRIPVPKSTGYSAENLNKATRFFPLIGWIVGGLGGATIYGASYVLPFNVAIIAGLVLMVLVTGAFHEDALADFCDGFGGGYNKTQILDIMKDSRIGTYGTVGLVLLLLSKYVLLLSFGIKQIPAILLVAHALSRFNAVLLIYTANYVKAEGKSKPIGEKSSWFTLLVAAVFGLAPLALLPWQTILVLLSAIVMALIYFGYYVKKKIGGYTGDVLGALQQISEVCCYVCILATNKILN